MSASRRRWELSFQDAIVRSPIKLTEFTRQMLSEKILVLFSFSHFPSKVVASQFSADEMQFRSIADADATQTHPNPRVS